MHTHKIHDLEEMMRSNRTVKQELFFSIKNSSNAIKTESVLIGKSWL